MRSRRRSLAYGLAGAGAIACAAATAVPVATGCTTHQCDPSEYPYTGGMMLDRTTYVTNDINQRWLDFGPNTTVKIAFPADVGRAPTDVETYVGTGDEPNGGPDFEAGQIYTPGAGQLAVINFLNSSGVWVSNGTCADYTLYAVVHFVAPSLVIFGGSGAPDGSMPLGDTATWNGDTSTSVAPATSPPPRSGAVIGTVNDHITLFSGLGQPLTPGGPQIALFDMWTWDGQTWTQVFTPQNYGPPPRYDAASGVVTVGGKQELVVFGGRAVAPDGGSIALDDTWTWDGAKWTQEAPQTSPPARSGAAAAGLGDTLAVFGGTPDGGATALGDTWVWRNGNWMEVSAGADAGVPSGTSPSARTHASAAPFNGRIVLFGGMDASGPRADTWLWDGSSWTEATPPVAPAARASAAMGVFDGSLLLFGGSSGTGANQGVLGDLWIWNGSTWTEQHAQGLPPARSAAAMAAN